MRKKGFTLAELLIALAILGVIAAFAIPKILSAQQDSTYKSIAKEAAASISAAFDAYKAQNSVTASTCISHLTPYLNYVKIDTVNEVDSLQTQTTIPCSGGSWQCFNLHNGAKLFHFGHCFGGTATTNAILFNIDPDGKVTGAGDNGPGKSVQFWLYTNGRLTTRGNILTGTTSNLGTDTANTALDPPWFSWN